MFMQETRRRERQKKTCLISKDPVFGRLILPEQTHFSLKNDLHFPQSTSEKTRPSDKSSNPHISANITTLLSKMVIQMIIWDFTIIKGRRGAHLHIQIIAQIIYVNMTECFVSRRNSFVTAAGGSKTTTT